MNPMQINLGTACLNQTPLDWRGNRERILNALQAAREQGVHLLCLPELCITGYTCEDAFLSSHTLRRALEILMDLQKHARGLVVSLGLPLLHERRLHNVCALLVDGQLAGLAAKQYLAGEGVHYEPRWFSPWPTGHREIWTAPDGTAVPIGDLTFDIGGLRIGFEICEDAWVADRPGIRHARRGVDVILNPSASHFAFGKHQVRERFVLEGSRAFHCAYLYSNLLGNESGRLLFDGDTFIAADGQLLAAGPRSSFHSSVLTSATVDIGRLRLGGATAARTASPPGDVATNRLTLPHTWPVYASLARPPQPCGELTRNEAFTRIMALGLFDYLRKSHSHGFVVSLSGGADSAAVVCLISIMICLALQELGEEAFAGALGLAVPPVDWVRTLLTTVYQATAQSGDTTRQAARKLAAALGANHLEWDVEDLVQAYVQRCADSMGRPLTWNTDDIALQNIQARVRAPGVWMLANLQGALLLSTSNRSEAAVGYATMDGDTCGGLAPLAGIDKAFLLRWLHWLETEGPATLGPMPFLSVINVQRPTAELRPAADAQSDESDLMPYDVLDAIEKAAIRDKAPPREVLDRMQEAFPDHAPADLRVWVVRFFRLWSRNQWKRERYAPGFHVDDENLDPKTWCRWPILSGGFADECTTLENTPCTP